MSKKRTRKHPFTKRNIDGVFKNAFLNPCVVFITKLTAEDIAKYKTSSIKNKNILSKKVSNISNISESDERPKDDLKLKSDKKSKANKTNKYNNISTVDESPIKKPKVDTNRIDNSSDKNVKPTIKLVDPRTLFNDEDRYLIAKPSTSRPKTPLCSAKVNGVKSALNEKNPVTLNLNEIEKLHKKYFSKFVQDSIVVIANIIIVILKSNEYHTEQKRESSKKSSEYQKLKEICDAKQFYERNNKILDIKLKKIFIDATSFFAESEFNSAFIMFFLSIFSVLQVLDRQRFKRGDIVKLIELLQKSSIISENNHPNIFSMLHSKTFNLDCMNVRLIIEDSQDTDPGVTDRMPLYFVKTTSGKYFQEVIDAVTSSDSNKNLASLIDIAIFQCCINSGLKDPVDSLPVQQSNGKILATQIIQSPINSDKTIKHLLSNSNTDVTYPVTPVIRGNKSSTIGNTTIESSIQSQPLNYLYTSQTSTLKKKTSESWASKVIPIKKCIVAPPTISNIPLVQVTASSSQNSTTMSFVSVQHPIQNNEFAGNTLLHRAEINTILIDNKPHKLLKVPSGQTKVVFTPTISNNCSLQITNVWSDAVTSTPGQMRATDNDTYVLYKQPSADIIIKCSVKYCNSPAKIMCNRCKLAKYCSVKCQTLDRFEHKRLDDCE